MGIMGIPCPSTEVLGYFRVPQRGREMRADLNRDTLADAFGLPSNETCGLLAARPIVSLSGAVPRYRGVPALPGEVRIPAFFRQARPI